MRRGRSSARKFQAESARFSETLALDGKVRGWRARTRLFIKYGRSQAARVNAGLAARLWVTLGGGGEGEEKRGV
jgi:hypothetical protein